MLKRLIYLLFCSLLLAGCVTDQEIQQTDLIQLSNQTVLSDNYLFLYAEPIGYEKTVINEDHCIYQSDQGTIEIISGNEIANVQTDELDASKEDLLCFANEQLGQAHTYEYAIINSVPFLSLKYSDGKQAMCTVSKEAIPPQGWFNIYILFTLSGNYDQNTIDHFFLAEHVRLNELVPND